VMNRANSLIPSSKQQLTIKDQTTSALQSQSFDKTTVCPWELEDERSVDRTQKHVSYAPGGVNVHSPDSLVPKSPKLHVCPWDFAPPPEASPAVERGVEGECDPTKPNSHVSASAPGTPRPMVSIDQRVFSFRSTTQKWLSVKAFIGSIESNDAQSRGAGSKRGSIVSQLSQESNATTRSAPSANLGVDRKTLPKRSLTTVDGKHCLVKQNAIRLSSGDSCDRSPRKPMVVKSGTHLWDSVEMQKDENVFPSRQNSIRSNTSSWGTSGSHSRTPSTHRRGSIRLTPARNPSTTDVCPWEVPQGQALQKQLSAKNNVCPWEVEETQASERTSVCPWESREQETMKRQGSVHSNVCPWETQDVPTTPRINVIQQLQSQSSQQSLGRTEDICPWESADLLQPVQRHGDVDANVCPWDVQGEQPEAAYENIKPSETKSLLKVPSAHDNKSLTSSSAPSTPLQVSKTADSCPWEFPDPPKNFADSCDWVEGEPNPPQESTSMKSEICPWDTGHEDKSKDPPKDICPWESASVHVEETDSARTNICPWETAPPDNNPTIEINLAKDMEKTTSQDCVRPGVCPRETEEADTTKTQVFKSSLVSLVSQDPPRANVCPWEEQPVVQKVQGHGGSLSDVSTGSGKQQEGVQPDVCPWETEEPARGDVCPWDSGGPVVLQKQDSARGDVCPWDSGGPVVLQKQDSARGDVCPWDSGGPEALQKQDSARGDVCPWDTEDPQKPSTSKAMDTQAPVTPEEPAVDSSTEVVEEATANVPLGRREASCPWQIEASLDNNSDVFTWEPENIPEEDEEEADAECEAEAFIFPSDL